MQWLAAVVMLAGCGRIAFEPADDPRIATLELRLGARAITSDMIPAFEPDTTSYALDVGLPVHSLQIAATAVVATTSVDIGGTAVAPGVTSDPLPLELGDNTIAITGTAASGATLTYTLVVRRAQQVAQDLYIKASNGGLAGAYDEFGYTVAISGDTMAIGGRAEDSSATGIDGDQLNDGSSRSGAVYVFVRVGGSWTQQAYLKASNAAVDDRFGGSVALDADTLVVGSRFEDSSATGVNGAQDTDPAPEHDAGAAYVFVRSAGVWSQQAYLKASNSDAGDEFGNAVAISGDTIAVGAAFDDSDANAIDGNQGNAGGLLDQNYGAVYVFERSGTAWSQQAYVKSSNASAGGQFGRAVDVEGDRLVVGAWHDSTQGPALAGAVYMFERTGVTWSQSAYLTASNSETQDRFGVDVSLSGNTVAVSALNEASGATGVNGDQTSNSAPYSGAVYVFLYGGGGWTQDAYLKASNTGTEDEFGSSVVLSGDTLVVAANAEKSLATGIGGNQLDDSSTVPVPANRPTDIPSGPGAAYLFTRSAGIWTQRSYIKASNTVDDNTGNRGNQFGYSLALDGGTLAIGAIYEDGASAGIGGDETQPGAGAAGPGENSGAVYVFE